MSKILAAMIAGLFAAGAFAQSGTPQDVQTNTKPQARAEMKKDAKPAGQVKTPAGDSASSQEVAGVPADKANMAGEKRAETRDARRRNKDGSLKRRSAQGGTPQ